MHKISSVCYIQFKRLRVFAGWLFALVVRFIPKSINPPNVVCVVLWFYLWAAGAFGQSVMTTFTVFNNGGSADSLLSAISASGNPTIYTFSDASSGLVWTGKITVAGIVTTSLSQSGTVLESGGGGTLDGVDNSYTFSLDQFNSDLGVNFGGDITAGTWKFGTGGGTHSFSSSDLASLSSPGDLVGLHAFGVNPAGTPSGSGVSGNPLYVVPEPSASVFFSVTLLVAWMYHRLLRGGRAPSTRRCPGWLARWRSCWSFGRFDVSCDGRRMNPESVSRLELGRFGTKSTVTGIATE